MLQSLEPEVNSIKTSPDVWKNLNFSNMADPTLILIKNTSMPTYYSQFQSLYGRLHTDPKWWFLPTYFAYGQPN